MAGKRKPRMKGVPKITPKALGTGLAYGAGEKLQGRAEKIAAQECAAMGGVWRDGKCAKSR
jgi:hypothetical protein